MKVAVYHSNDDIRIEERPQPELSEGEILVKMRASGICGTDVMQWYRIKKSPRILGHEMAGEIVAKKSVKNFKIGDRVFVSHHVPCYKCHRCLKGNYTACESLHSGNFDPGGFSEFIRVPAQNVKYGTFLLPNEMSFEEATMIEPMGCVIAGQKQAGVKENDTVLVIGSGVSGLLHIQLAKTKKAKVIATDINEYKLKKAIEFGADKVIDARSYSVDKLKKSNNDRLVEDSYRADIVIVCAASREAITHALSSVERKGVILFFAVPEDNIAIPSDRFWRDEITITFSYGAAPDDLKYAMELIRSGKINVRDMITHRIPFSNIQQGFKLASESKESLKVVVVP